LQPERGLAGLPAGWFDGAHEPQVLIPQSSAAYASASVEFLALLANGDFEEVRRRLIPAGNAFEQPARDEDWTSVNEYFARPARPEPSPDSSEAAGNAEETGRSS
jgi:hypothetical protein